MALRLLSPSTRTRAGDTATTVTTVSPAVAASTGNGSQFFDLIHQRIPGITLADAEGVARAACADFDAEGVEPTMDRMQRDGLDGSQLSSEDFGYLVGVGTAAYCPRHQPAFANWVDARR